MEIGTRIGIKGQAGRLDYYGLARSALFGINLSPEDREDAIQVGAMAIFRKAEPKLDQQRNETAYCRATARSAVLDMLRSQQRRDRGRGYLALRRDDDRADERLEGLDEASPEAMLSVKQMQQTLARTLLDVYRSEPERNRRAIRLWFSGEAFGDSAADDTVDDELTAQRTRRKMYAALEAM